MVLHPALPFHTRAPSLSVSFPSKLTCRRFHSLKAQIGSLPERDPRISVTGFEGLNTVTGKSKTPGGVSGRHGLMI